MKWTTRKDYEEALKKYNNEMYYVGKFGTLEQQRVLYNEYNLVWEDYKLTQGLKKVIFVVVLALVSFIGYKFYTNSFGVEEVTSCAVTNSCTYKNQD